MQVSDISMKWYENDLSFNAYQATKKYKIEGKRSRNLLKLTLRIEEEMNKRCIITKRGYQFHKKKQNVLSKPSADLICFF